MRSLGPFQAYVPEQDDDPPRVTATADKRQIGIAISRLKSSVSSLRSASFQFGVMASESEEVAEEIRRALDEDD